jgi:hypothetical protein
MSATPHQATPHQASPHQGDRRPAHPALPVHAPLALTAPALSRLEVRWRVSRRALGAHAPGGGSRLIELAVQVDGLDAPGAARARVLVTDPASRDARVVEIFDGVAAEVIPDVRSQVHVECPGVLHATIAPGDTPDSWRLVYARTPVLDALGVPGGRAEAVGVTGG